MTLIYNGIRVSKVSITLMETGLANKTSNMGCLFMLVPARTLLLQAMLSLAHIAP
jgi:hypothetical protein